MKPLLGIAAGLMLMASALEAAPINYSENFNTWGPTGIPTSASSVADYWYFVNDPNAYYNGGYMAGGVNWGGGGPDGSNWLYAAQGSGSGAGHFHGQAYRNFRTAGTLAAGETFGSATVSAYARNGTGSDADTSLFSGLWLVDNAGNGYAGRIVRAGTMTLYESVGWALTSIGTGASGVGGNAKYCSLSVIAGTVTLSFQYSPTGTVYSKSVADSTYTEFTTIGLEGAYFTNEELGFDNITLTGVIPEPATAGLLAVAGALVLRRRRKQG